MYPRRSYSERLLDRRWAEFRKVCERFYMADPENRDERIECGFCWREEAERKHLHHKFYIEGREPWEYEPQDMMFVCGRCHEQLHKDALQVWTYLLSSNEWINIRVTEAVERLSKMSHREQLAMWGRFVNELRSFGHVKSRIETLAEVVKRIA